MAMTLMPLRIKFKFSPKKGTLRNFPPIIFKDNEKNPQSSSRVGVDYRLPSKEQQWKLEDSSIFSISWKNKKQPKTQQSKILYP